MEYSTASNVGFLSVLFSIVFGIFYIATTSIGIKTYNECEEIRGVKKWDDLNLMLMHTMTISMTIPFVLIAQMFVGSKVTAGMAIIYGILGLIGNATSFAMTKEEPCAGATSKDSKNYLIFGMVASIVVILGGGYVLRMG